MIEKEFADGKHGKCLDEVDTYFNEIIEKEIEGQYIFQVWAFVKIACSIIFTRSRVIL